MALTAVNPLTALYFVALSTGLASRHTGGPAVEVAFVAGVFVGSWGWQLVLARLGATGGAWLSPRVRGLVSATGYLVVLSYAVRLLV